MRITKKKRYGLRKLQESYKKVTSVCQSANMKKVDNLKFSFVCVYKLENSVDVVCALLGNFPASEFYIPRNTLSVPSS